MKFKNLLIITTMAVLFFACSEDEEEQSPAISNDESAEIVAESLNTEVNELTGSVGNLVSSAENGRSEGISASMRCGVSFDTTIVKTWEGNFQSIDLTVNYDYELVCEGIIPNELQFTYDLTGTRVGPRSSSNKTSEGSFITTGLVGDDAYSIGGQSIATGTTTLTLQNQERILNGQTTLTVTDLTIDKSAQMITGGQATLSYLGSTSEGRSVEFSASITFNGEQTAEVTINGQTFDINWSTGQVTG